MELLKEELGRVAREASEQLHHTATHIQTELQQGLGEIVREATDGAESRARQALAEVAQAQQGAIVAVEKQLEQSVGVLRGALLSEAQGRNGEAQRKVTEF